MSSASFDSSSGRAASIARRQALSAGKSALPPATERVRTGHRSAALPDGLGSSTQAPEPAAAREFVAQTEVATPVVAGGSASGRTLSMLRRQQLSGGKRTLQAARNAAPGESTTATGAPHAAPISASPAHAPVDADCCTSCRDQARARRANLSQYGRAALPAAPPSRPPREGRLDYAPKVTESSTHGGQIVTGSRIGRGTQVTGNEPGSQLPVSGTQYIGAGDGAPVRSGGPKVGLARTSGGVVVSGTLVRSQVRVTGDEPGGRIRITGEADQTPEDDLTPRSADSAYVTAQFNRQVDPHGHSVFGTNLGRSARVLGSRVRTREAFVESTESGLPITGSAVGRGSRVTGDEDGVCRVVTGSQYLTPARAQAECGGLGGGTAPAAQLGSPRRDPVTGAKVTVGQTWGGQSLTGTNVEHDPRVTGDAPGSCALITGTPYQGATTLHGWCDTDAVAAAEQRLPRRAATAQVSGDVPRPSDRVTGIDRGAVRDVTGTPYFRAEATDAAADRMDALAGLDARFSVSSPQRRAQLQVRAAREAERSVVGQGAGPSDVSPTITGSFAIGRERVTGNTEFCFRSRSVAGPDNPPAHGRLTGEGRAQGARITGSSWSEQSNVTGTEGAIAVERNPSERAGEPQSFAGARRFKTLAKTPETRQLVTGLLGWSGKTAARVTLSGGAPA